MNYKRILLILVFSLAAACTNENKESQSDQEFIDVIGDEAITEELNQKLINATRQIGQRQELDRQSRNENELEKLSEEDRQVLIDLTIEQGAKKIEEDANSVVEEKSKNIIDD